MWRPHFRLCRFLGLLFTLNVIVALGQPSPAPRQSYRDQAAPQWRAAITTSNSDRVRQLLSSISTNDCLEIDEQGATALHWAARVCAAGASNPQAFEILRLLSSRGPCLNAVDRLGRKPILELAPLNWTSRGRMDALSILLANGADVNAQDQNGTTLLQQLLGTWNAGSLHWPEVVRVLIAPKANPNLTNSTGQSALHSFFGPLGFCTNHTGVRATTVAVAQQVFVMLIDAGANVRLKDSEGTTPLGTLLLQSEPFFGTKETILGFTSSTLSNRLQIGAATIKQRPALLYLCDQARADAEVVERLLELGADAKLAEPDGFTALHGAAYFYNYRICELLLARGANANSINEKGRTALHELARSSYCNAPLFVSDQAANLLQTASVLLAHGADRRLKDKNGKTALDLFKGVTPDDPELLELMRRVRKVLR
jgi:ankyrin repeat protein